MTEFDACMGFLVECRNRWDAKHAALLAEYREAKAEGWEEDVTSSIRQDKRDAAIRRNLLDNIIGEIGDAVSDRLQECANKVLTTEQ